MRARVGWKGELEFAGCTEDDRAGRTVKFRLVRRPEELASSHPFATFTRRRGKMAGTIFEGSIFSVASPDAATYAGELMLINWSDGPQGATVSFLLDPDSERHPFLGYSRPSKQEPGSRFMAVLLEKGDDGAVIDQEQRERAERVQKTGKTQTLSNVAAMIIKNPRFHDFLREKIEAVDWSQSRADKWLKGVLKIDSKSALDDPKNAQVIAGFHRIRKAFVTWQEEQGDRFDR